jgi:2,4-dienoyl-CoA reductase-like NADH-dependent reductase (Old Yellow Enzyme family)
MRFMQRVIRCVMEHAGSDMGVIVKMNMHDGFKRGMQRAECLEVARELERLGVHALVLSAGFVSKAPMEVMRGAMPIKTMAYYMDPRKFWWLQAFLHLAGRLVIPTVPYREGYFLEDAKQFREAVRLPLIYVGGVQSRENCETVLGEGFDLIQMAHVLIQDPAFVNHMKEADLSYRSKCGRSNYCVGRMYTLEMKCHECVSDLPCKLKKEIEAAEAENARTVAAAKGA